MKIGKTLLFGALGLSALAACGAAARPFLASDDASELAAPQRAAPKTNAAFFRQGEKLLGAGEVEGALKLGRDWQKAHPRDAKGFVIAGRALAMKGDLDGAIQSGKQAQALDPQSHNWVWLDELQRIRKRYPKLQFYPLTPVKSAFEAQSDALSTRAQPLLRAQKYDEIERIAAQLLASRAELPGGSWKLAAFALPLCQAGDSEAQWQANNARLQAWHRARPQSKLARLMLGRSWSDGAFTARGEDWAANVKDKQWALMNQRLAAAAPLLGASMSDLKTTPLVFSGLQSWALLGQVPRPTYEKAWKEALAAFPGYVPFYAAKAIYLMPRWYGEPGEWEAFAGQSADQIGGARGDRLYAQIVEDQSQYLYDADFFAHNAISWPRAKRGFRALFATGGDPVADASQAQRLAAIARDDAFEQELFRGPLAHSYVPLGDDPKADLAVLCRNRIHAFAG